MKNPLLKRIGIKALIYSHHSFIWLLTTLKNALFFVAKNVIKFIMIVVLVTVCSYFSGMFFTFGEIKAKLYIKCAYYVQCDVQKNKKKPPSKIHF